jgi:hypothetical protein
MSSEKWPLGDEIAAGTSRVQLDFAIRSAVKWQQSADKSAAKWQHSASAEKRSLEGI